MDFQVENREKLIMGGFRNSGIFRHRFSIDLGRFWVGFWEGFGRVLGALGPPKDKTNLGLWDFPLKFDFL